jgi:hypothetical protein
MNQWTRAIRVVPCVLFVVVLMDVDVHAQTLETAKRLYDANIKVFWDNNKQCRYRIDAVAVQDSFKVDPNRYVRLYTSSIPGRADAQIIVGNQGAKNEGPYSISRWSPISSFETRAPLVPRRRTEHDVVINCCERIRKGGDGRPICVHPQAACAITDDRGRCRETPNPDRPRRGPSVEEPLRAMWDHPPRPILRPGGPRMIIIE